MFSFLRLVLIPIGRGGTDRPIAPEWQLPKVGGVVARSLSLCGSIAVGVIGAVLLAVAGEGGAAAGAEACLLLPDADAARGRALFVSKGCVVCHAINEVGGDQRTAARR